MKVTLDNDRLLFTVVSEMELKWLESKLVWYHQEGTLKDIRSGDLLKVKPSAKMKAGKIGTFVNFLGQGKEATVTVGFGEERRVFKRYQVMKVAKETLIYKDKAGNRHTFWGLYKLLKREAPFPIELTNPPVSNNTRVAVRSDILTGVNLYDFQMVGVQKCVTIKRGLCIVPTGGGKCHGSGTKIRMFDGSVKVVENIRPGDCLLGPDSKHRLVKGISRGHGNLFKVIPTKGEIWVCNEDHILSLKHTETKEIVNISIKDWLNLSKYERHCLKLYRASVEFDEKELPVDPYWLGLYLGDGTFVNGRIIAQELEIKDWMKNYSDCLGLNFYQTKDTKGDCWNFWISGGIEGSKTNQHNPLTSFLKKFGMKTGKYIPKDFLFNSRENRLKLLAGLCDTDGHLHHGFFEIVTKSAILREDILTLSRSLGFAAYYSVKWVRREEWEHPRPYYRISISGDVGLIPCRVAKKQAKPRLQKKDVLVTGFSVESIGRGDYFGFTLECDHLYCLWDFTVTHNTEMMLATIRTLIETDKLRRGLVIVPSQPLADQFADRALKRGFNRDEIGIVHGNKKEYDRLVTVAVINSVNLGLQRKDQDVLDLVNDSNFLCFDETHHLRSDSNINLARRASHVDYLLGFSGSPFLLLRPFENSGDTLIWGMTGGPIFQIGYDHLLKIGLIAQPIVHMKKVPGVMAKYAGRFQTVYDKYIVKDPQRNGFIVNYANRFVKYHFQVLILVQRLEHALSLMEMLSDQKVICVFGGKTGWVMENGTPTEFVVNYDSFRESFGNGVWDIVIGSTVLDEGVDIPTVGAVISAGSGKCFGKNTQILMYDGIEKAVQDVKVGDIIMGDNGSPRVVLSTTKGKEDLFKITPNSFRMGKGFVCNRSHNLIFKLNINVNKDFQSGSTYVMTVDKFLKHPLSSIRKHACLFKSDGLSFSKKKLIVDPYWLGLWLGDGTYREGSISCNIHDIEIIDWLKNYADENEMSLKSRANSLSDQCVNYWISGGMENSRSNRRSKNPIWEFLKTHQDMNGKGNKYIPKQFMRSSREQRLKLLAGLIDSDGYHHCGGFEIVSVYKKLTNDISFLARSLGFRVVVSYSERNHSETSHAISSKVLSRYRISISGETSEIPCLLPRKQALQRVIRKKTTQGGFSIEPLGIGEYYGFELNEPTFLLADFTVVHNSRIKNLQRLGRGLRAKTGINRVYVIDFMDRGHVYMASHSRQRLDLYKEVKAKIIEDDFELWRMVAEHAKSNLQDKEQT